MLNENDELQWLYDKDNEYDKRAVKILKNNTLLGYVKIIHSCAFYKKGGENLKIKVKSIDKNGKLNRVFIKVYNYS
jgi:predicted thioredoxin/glutaredoxin